MMPIWISAVFVGVALLVWGSDRFVLGASVTAQNLGVPPLVVGLTVVGVGTSAPEFSVSATAALGGNPGVAVGNAVGSNIANIGLVAGVCALIVPLSVKSEILRREFPLMFVAIALAWYVLNDGFLGFTDGLLLVASFAAFLGLIVRAAANAKRSDPLILELRQHIPSDMATGTAVIWLLAGLLVLLLGSRLIVWGAVGVARALELSDLVIGLTIVAVGTSLPELAASVASVLKKEPDLAVGNVLHVQSAAGIGRSRSHRPRAGGGGGVEPGHAGDDIHERGSFPDGVRFQATRTGQPAGGWNIVGCVCRLPGIFSFLYRDLRRLSRRGSCVAQRVKLRRVIFQGATPNPCRSKAHPSIRRR